MKGAKVYRALKERKWAVSAVALGLVISAVAGLAGLAAGQTFTLVVTSTAHPGQVYSVDYTSLGDLQDKLTQNTIASNFAGFDPNNDPINATTNIYGMNVTVSVAANSNNVRIQIPDLGVDTTLTASSRLDTVEKLRYWAVVSGADTMAQIQAQAFGSGAGASSGGCLISVSAD